MLNLCSYRDFSKVFQDDRGLELLSPREREELEGLAGHVSARQWLLVRLTAKQLCQRVCDERWGFIPDAHDLSVLSNEDGSVSLAFEGSLKDRIEQPLSISVDHSARYAIACVRDAMPGHHFGVSIAAVDCRYPFFEESAFSESEVLIVRTCEPAVADSMLTAIETMKTAARRALGPDAALDVLGLRTAGAAQVSLAGLATARVWAGSWTFEHHALGLFAAWLDPAHAPAEGDRIEEDPVLPTARHDEETLG